MEILLGSGDKMQFSHINAVPVIRCNGLKNISSKLQWSPTACRRYGENYALVHKFHVNERPTDRSYVAINNFIVNNILEWL